MPGHVVVPCPGRSVFVVKPASPLKHATQRAFGLVTDNAGCRASCGQQRQPRPPAFQPTSVPVELRWFVTQKRSSGMANVLEHRVSPLKMRRSWDAAQWCCETYLAV